MDYQTSTSCSKINLQYIAKKAFFLVLFAFTGCSSVVAQTTTNPLIVDVTISAAVLVNPGTRPDTPPLSPGPINMTNTIDAAIFRGMASPGSTISILRNGIVVSELPANADGTFDMRIRNVVAGTYSFGVRAKDRDGLQSKLLTFTIYISPGVATIVDGIFIPPTITTDKIEVTQNNVLKVYGSAAAHSEIRLSFNSGTEFLRETTANASGTWYYLLNTAGLSYGDYEVKARSITATSLSLYSDTISFRVGDSNRVRPKDSLLGGFRKKCDLNNDNRVNLLDFSIMAFWYKRLGFPEKVDLNSDKSVNLTDLSILAYCWTG